MKVLMVCLGNICRSPLAEGILRSKIQANGLNWEVDSVGTSSWHIGDPPHKESISVAADHGIDITNQRARQFSSIDFDTFDLILTMDSQNYLDVTALASTPLQKVKVKLLLNYLFPEKNMAVPDPYFTGGFEEVYNLIDRACEELLKKHKEWN